MRERFFNERAAAKTLVEPRSNRATLSELTPSLTARLLATLRGVSVGVAASIVARRVRSVAGAFFRFRALLVPPAALCGWTIAFRAHAPSAQLRAMAAGTSATALFFVYEAVRARAPMSDRRLSASLVLTVLALAGAAMITGAISSPMVPLLFAPTLTALAAWGRSRRESLAVLLSFVLALLALFALRSRAPFGPLPAHAPLALLFSLVTVALLFSSVAGLADAYAEAAREIDRLREESVARVLERSRALEAVGATVAHEIKNPLAAIKGLVQLMARDERPEREARRIDVIAQEIARIESVLAQYLTFARPLDALRRERIELGAAVQRVIDALEPRAARASISLLRDGAATWLSVDRAKIEAALMNVLLNAIEASPEGARVEVRWQSEGASLVITVRDQGRGMDAATLARVGTAFFTTRPDGTGLGLVVARGAVEQHGGTLVLHSREGEGSTVEITLALEEGS